MRGQFNNIGLEVRYHFRMQGKINLGDVVEIVTNEQKWAIGCLAFVDGVYNWGVSGYVAKPFMAHTGPTKIYIRLDYDQIHLVGPSFRKLLVEEP